MTAVITANNPLTRDTVAPAPAVHSDGSNYEWRMFFDQGRRIADADSLDELLDILSPGYSFLQNDEERRDARIALAKQVQALSRGVILSSVTPEKAAEIEDWEWNVLTFGEDEVTDPFGWGEGEGILGELNEELVDFWKSDIPLVLLETSYAPFTEIPIPVSIHGDYWKDVPNMIWLRPFGDLEFLRSLSRIGYISFGSPNAAERPDPHAH